MKQFLSAAGFLNSRRIKAVFIKSFATLALVSTMSMPQPALAATGKELVTACMTVFQGAPGAGESAEHAEARVKCAVYLDAVHEAQMFYSRNGVPKPYCLPDQVIKGQIIVELQKGLERYPKQAAGDAASYIYLVLHDAYPCPAGPKT